MDQLDQQEKTLEERLMDGLDGISMPDKLRAEIRGLVKKNALCENVEVHKLEGDILKEYVNDIKSGKYLVLANFDLYLQYYRTTQLCIPAGTIIEISKTYRISGEKVTVIKFENGVTVDYDQFTTDTTAPRFVVRKLS